MIFEKYSDLEGMHAFLSPSQPHWLRYDDDKLRERYLKSLAVQRGTELHEFANKAITLSIPLPRNKNCLNQFVNDVIGYNMSSEQKLFYNGFCFGTADAIDYRKNRLRIYDLKTGETEAHMDQLKVYAALFCLNYQNLVRQARSDGRSDNDIARKYGLKPAELHFDPKQMTDIELRIYQYAEVREEHPDPEEIRDIMDIIVHEVEVLKDVKAEGIVNE